MANGDVAVGPSGVPRITIYPPGGGGSLGPFDPIGADAEPSAPSPQELGPFEAIGSEEKPAAAPPPPRPPPPPTSASQRLLTDFLNQQQAAAQRTTPIIAAQKPYEIGPALQNEEGDIGYAGPNGQFVPTDRNKHVVLTDPNDNVPKVYLRNAQTAEGLAASTGRFLGTGMGAGNIRFAGPAEATVTDLKNAATAVYQDPAIRGRAVNRNAIVTAFRDIVPRLRTFPPDVQQRILSTLRMPSATIGDLDNASQSLGHIADEVQMTAAGPKPTAAAAAASIVKDKIDGVIRQIAPEFATADANYAAAKAAETISGRAGKAEILSRGGDFVGRMQTQATQLLANPRYLRAFTPAEIEQLRQISEGTIKGDALRRLSISLSGKVGSVVGALAGSHTGVLGTIVGGIAGAAGEAMLGKILTALGNALTANQVNRLSRAIRARSPEGQAFRYGPQLLRRVEAWQRAMEQAKTGSVGPAMAETARNLAQALLAIGVTVRATQFMPSREK